MKLLTVKSRYMKTIIMCILCFVCSSGVGLTEELPNLISESAIVYNINTDEIVYEKNIDIRYYPASTTKLITAYLAKQNLNMNDYIEFSQRAIMENHSDGSNIGAIVGEKMLVRDALYALLLQSGNEVANALAEKIDGTLENFAYRMNLFAAQVGVKNTHFVTANGLPDINHYTTARDMAKMVSKIYKDEEVTKISGTFKYITSATNIKKSRNLKNTHKMFDSSNEYYLSNIVGGKTGSTIEGKHALVTYFNNNGEEYVVVILKSTAIGRYVDTKWLIQYTTANYGVSEIIKPRGITKEVPVNKNGKTIKQVGITNFDGLYKTIKLNKLNNLRYEYEIPEYISYSVEEGQIIGKVKAYSGSDLIGEVNLVANENSYMPVNISTNTEKLKFVDCPIIKNNTTYVPFEEFLQHLGYSIQDRGETIFVKNLTNEFYISKKENTIKNNKMIITSDKKWHIINEKLYVPIKDLADATDMDIEWINGDIKVKLSPQKYLTRILREIWSLDKIQSN